MERTDSLRTDDTAAAMDNAIESSTALRSNQSTGGESDEGGEEDEADYDDDDLNDEVFALLVKEKSQPALHTSSCRQYYVVNCDFRSKTLNKFSFLLTSSDASESFVPPPGEEENYILTRVHTILIHNNQNDGDPFVQIFIMKYYPFSESG